MLEYLTQAIEVKESYNKIIEIGGDDIMSYGDMIKEYARIRGLKRSMISVPFLTPRLSSYWVHWMTPVPASITRPLIEGLKNEVIVKNHYAGKIFPKIKPVDYQTAIIRTLKTLESGKLESRWTDSLTSSNLKKSPVILTTHEGIIIERREIKVKANSQNVFSTFISLGGDQGWLHWNWAWRVRGAIDRLIGGVGLRRGRRDPNSVRVGDAIDFWRVEKIKNNQLLRLRAEIKLPGFAWLQFEVLPKGNNESSLVQTAYFAPKGLSGLLYWYGLYPFHSIIFSGLIQKIGIKAEQFQQDKIQ